MRFNHWKDPSAPVKTPTSQKDSGSLETKIRKTFDWSNREFKISDLSLSTVEQTGKLLCTVQLEEKGGQNTVKTDNSDYDLFLYLPVEGKEISLLSGLLGRSVLVSELKQTRLQDQEALFAEIQRLREENHNLRVECDNLYGALESIQRPKLIS